MKLLTTLGRTLDSLEGVLDSVNVGMDLLNGKLQKEAIVQKKLAAKEIKLGIDLRTDELEEEYVALLQRKKSRRDKNPELYSQAINLLKGGDVDWNKLEVETTIE